MFITMKNLPPVAKALIALLVILLAAETLLRSVEGTLSGNVAHIVEIPELADNLNKSNKPGLLILGNSLTNDGIDASQLQSGLNMQGLADSTIEKIVPDGTTIWSWTCILRNRIYELKNKPDTVLIGFAWGQLADQSRLLPTSLGGFFCSYKDLIHITEQATMNSAQIGEFVTASTFRLFTHREAIRNKILSILIPHYMTSTQEINRRLRGTNSAASASDTTYRELSLTIEQLKSYGKDIVLMAMPVRNNPYSLDPELLNTVKNKDITLLDYRNLDFITDDLFTDEMHLTKAGSALLTARLVDDLAKIRSTPH